jgi:hypothetical protein
MSMRSSNARYSADAVDLGARSGLIGAAEPMSIQAVLAVQIGGSAIALDDLLRQAA